MNAKLLWLQLGLLLLGGVLLAAGDRLNLIALTSLGIGSIGLFALVSGAAAIITKRLGFETDRPNFGRREFYTGKPAQLWGVLFVGFAILCFVFALVILFYPGGAEAFWAYILGRTWGWGIVLGFTGLAVLTGGIIRLAAGGAGYYQGLPDLVERISGVIPLIFGLLLAAVGVLLIAAPGWIIGLGKLLISFFQRWFLGTG